MVGKCNIEELKRGLYEIINDKSYYGEDEEVYIEILGNNFRDSDDDIEKVIGNLILDNDLMNGSIYIMDSDFTNDDIENIDDIEEIEYHEIQSYMNYTNGDKYMMYIGYTPWIEEAYHVYLKKVRIEEDGTRCFF